MKFDQSLIPATLLRRYKRFLADVELDDGKEITVHCPNTGSMRHCIVENSLCWLLDSNNPKRKYRFSLERVTTPSGATAGINSARANTLVVEAIQSGVIEELQGYEAISTEQKYGSENSRIDILLQSPGQQCFVEVKSVTLEEQTGQGFFPDAVSTRGQKHLRELIAMREAGHRAVLLFCVQHTGIESVSPAAHIDPKYSELFRVAIQAGVQVLAYGVAFSEDGVNIVQQLPIVE